VVTLSGEKMERTNPTSGKFLLYDGDDGFLQFEDSPGIKKGLLRGIKVHVLNIEVDNK